MRVGVVHETAPGERRVALVPETAGKLAAAGFEIVVEGGAGDAASFLDAAYTAAGVTLGSPWEADVVVAVRRPDADPSCATASSSSASSTRSPIRRASRASPRAA